MLMISSHGMAGNCSRAVSDIRVAASPKIAISITNDKTNWRFEFKSPRVRPRANDTASCAASIMCRRRISSSLRIMDFRRGENILPKITAQILRRAQVHLPPAEQVRQLPLHAGHAQQSRRAVRLELDEHVDIAIGAEVLAQRPNRRRRTASRREPGKNAASRSFSIETLRGSFSRPHGTSFLFDDKTTAWARQTESNPTETGAVAGIQSRGRSRTALTGQPRPRTQQSPRELTDPPRIFLFSPPLTQAEKAKPKRTGTHEKHAHPENRAHRLPAASRRSRFRR